MRSRRDLLNLATPLCGVALAPSLALAEQATGKEEKKPACPPDIYRSQLGFIGPEGTDAASVTVAGGAPRHDEIAVAFRLLFDVPRTGSSWDVACYLRDLKVKNAAGDPYNWEWKTRANPLIVGFHALTQTLPDEGDRTPWCAAFVSFCLYAGGKATERTASALKYRDYRGARVTDPVIGDIVVFRDTKDMIHGHVGFFAGWQKGSDGKPTGKFRVLGGNQGGAAYGGGADGKGGGAIIESLWGARTGKYELVGFWRPKDLKGADHV